MLNAENMDAVTVDEFMKEINIMHQIRSKYVINFYGACTNKANPAIVMELMKVYSPAVFTIYCIRLFLLHI